MTFQKYRSNDIYKVALVAVLYFLTAKIGLSLAYGTPQATTVWPPAGIALATMLLLGFRYWPGIWIGAFLANLTTNETPLLAASIAMGNTLEALAGAAWLRRVKFQHLYNRIRDVWVFIGIALAVVLISAFVGVTSLGLAREISWSGFQDTMRVWYLGDLMGILIIMPVILLWPKPMVNPFQRRHQGSFFLFGTVLLTQLLTYFRSFTPSELLSPRSYQAFPLVIWAAIKTSPFGTAMVTLIISMIAVVGTTHGTGPFTQQPTIEANLISLQSFLFYVVATGMTLAAIVAERRTAEQALLRALGDLEESRASAEQDRAQAQSLLTSIGEGIIATDPDGMVLLFNNAAEQMLGYRARDVLGKNWLKVNDVIDNDGQPIPVASRPLQRALRKGQRVVGNYVFVRKDGTSFPVAATATPVKFRGQTIGVVKVFRDITREQEVDRAKTEFVSLASHQLRTPLTAINWLTERLLSGAQGKLNRKEHAYIEQVSHSNQRMIDLVNALLNVSRIELGTFTVDPHPTDLKKVANSVVNELRPEIENKRLGLVTKYDQRLPHINVDEKLIRIVFQNLISNAVKYTPKGGQIVVSCTKQPKTITISIKDTGIGIPPAFQEKLFKKMFRADNAVEADPDGTGLGLYITKAIVDRANGQIQFTSKLGIGTTLSVILPMSGMKPQVGSRTLMSSAQSVN